jgi:hypothetical protein
VRSSLTIVSAILLTLVGAILVTLVGAGGYLSVRFLRPDSHDMELRSH